MGLLRYKKKNTNVLAMEIQRELNLGAHQRELLDAHLSKYQVFTWDNTPPAHPAVRLTILVFVVYFLLLTIGMGVKWVFTGKTHYEYEGFLMTIYRQWKNALGF